MSKPTIWTWSSFRFRFTYTRSARVISPGRLSASIRARLRTAVVSA
jgi:hypothetical protein